MIVGFHLGSESDNIIKLNVWQEITTERLPVVHATFHAHPGFESDALEAIVASGLWIPEIWFDVSLNMVPNYLKNQIS